MLLMLLVLVRVNFTYDFDFNIVRKESQEYIEPLKPTVTFKSGSGYVDFGDLISADSALGLYNYARFVCVNNNNMYVL